MHQRGSLSSQAGVQREPVHFVHVCRPGPRALGQHVPGARHFHLGQHQTRSPHQLPGQAAARGIDAGVPTAVVACRRPRPRTRVILTWVLASATFSLRRRRWRSSMRSSASRFLSASRALRGRARQARELSAAAPRAGRPRGASAPSPTCHSASLRSPAQPRSQAGTTKQPQSMRPRSQPVSRRSAATRHARSVSACAQHRTRVSWATLALLML